MHDLHDPLAIPNTPSKPSVRVIFFKRGLLKELLQRGSSRERAQERAQDRAKEKSQGGAQKKELKRAIKRASIWKAFILCEVGAMPCRGLFCKERALKMCVLTMFVIRYRFA